MQYMTPEEVAIIDSAKDADQAMNFCGTTTANGLQSNAHYIRMEYIKQKRGGHAVSGYFVRSVANVNAKFRKVWEEENEGK